MTPLLSLTSKRATRAEESVWRALSRPAHTSAGLRATSGSVRCTIRHSDLTEATLGLGHARVVRLGTRPPATSRIRSRCPAKRHARQHLSEEPARRARRPPKPPCRPRPSEHVHAGGGSPLTARTKRLGTRVPAERKARHGRPASQIKSHNPSHKVRPAPAEDRRPRRKNAQLKPFLSDSSRRPHMAL
jgi:hypothetical protein